MFNANFYPTPKWLAQKMIAPFDLADAYVLEPSAGKGDILDVISNKYDRYRKPNLYAIEIEPELRSILEGKGYPVIGIDFLLYEPRIHFTQSS
jgi:phospholipid N-methyltransferase